MVCQKMGHGSYLVPITLFLLNHEIWDAQEALEMGQIYKFGFDLLEEVGHTTMLPIW